MSKNDNSAVEQAATDEALASAKAAGVTEGAAQGAAAERERIAAILDSDVAASRPTAARQVALNTDMAMDKALAFLAALPEEKKEEAASATSSFEAAMNSGANPELGAAGGDDMSRADMIFASAGFKAKS